MLRGLYTSALGMTTQQSRMDVVSNNIANVNTTGFKREAVASQSFASRLAQKIDDPTAPTSFLLDRMPIGLLSQGLFIDEVFTDFSNGPLRRTNNSLDLAIMGQGSFFTVQAPGENGEMQTLYTRDGAFTLGPNGMLLTMDGAQVMGLNGAITMPNGYIIINEQGSIFVNDVLVDTLRVVDIPNPESLRQARDTMFTATDATIENGFSGQVEQGFLEGSNVVPVREMVELITLSRAYEANSRMIQLQDETLGRAVNDIAKR
jgi:flagellar basal-body rod protein FlgG